MHVQGVIFGKNFHWESTRSGTYPGKFICLSNPAEDGVQIINELFLEKYIESVVASEMNPNAPTEFIRAHAIISRTWSLRKLIGFRPSNKGRINGKEEISTWQESDAHSYFNVCSDDHCQRYQGICSNEKFISTVLEPVKGMVLLDSEKMPADTRFSKCCGGETEIFSTCWAREDYPYLTHLSDPYCNPEILETSKREEFIKTILKDYDYKTEYYKWKVKVPRSLISQNLFTLYSVNIGDIKDLIPLKRGPSGRIYKMLIKGSEGEIIVGKELTIRRLLSSSHLLSSAFNIVENNGEYFVLEGRGWGHGVGLCQIGAATMAYKGFSAEEILSFYFSNTILKKIY